MQITNYWAQPQVQQNQASTSAASTKDFLNTLAKGSGSNNSGTADASQSAIAGASMVSSFSASLAATNVGAASTGSDTSTTPNFTNMSDKQMTDWALSQEASGAMTSQQFNGFIDMAVRPQDSPLTGGNIANQLVPHNYIELGQQIMASQDHASARFFKPAVDMMLQLQSQSSQNTGNPAGTAQSQTAYGSGAPEVGWLTASDVKLIQQTTGQTIDPSTGNVYDANGQRVALSQSASSLANTLSTIRHYGVSESSGTSTMVSGAITAADLQTEMQFFAGDPQDLTGTNNFSAVTQAISVLNGTAANKTAA